MDIGKQIMKSRKNAGLSQSQLAHKTGLTRQTIGNYETGAREPTVKSLVKIAEVLKSEFVVEHKFDDLAIIDKVNSNGISTEAIETDSEWQSRFELLAVFSNYEVHEIEKEHFEITNFLNDKSVIISKDRAKEIQETVFKCFSLMVDSK